MQEEAALTDSKRCKIEPLHGPSRADIGDRSSADVSLWVIEFGRADHWLVDVLAVDGDNHGDCAIGRK